MSETDVKADLHRYLQEAREALLWKLDGLSEYDVRRPMTRTGSNLLGIVKHVATTELAYFRVVFDRSPEEPLPWFHEGAEPQADMWATPEESREQITGLYRRSWAHADATIDELPLDAVGHVPWWTPGNQPTLHRILVHMIAETNRHAGHADILREEIDGSAGFASDDDNLGAGPGEDAWWQSYRERLERVAREAAP